MKPVQEWEVKVENTQLHKCDQCPKAFRNTKELTMHVKRHEDWSHRHVYHAYVKLKKIDILKCDRCQQGFLTEKKLMLHRLVHIQQTVKKEVDFEDSSIVKPYKCPDCDYRFVAESTLDAHYVLHLPYPHICDCGIGYYKLEDLTSHQELMNCKKPQIKDKKLINNNLIKKTQDIINRTRIYGGKRPLIPRPPLDVDFPMNKNGQRQCPECHKWFRTKNSAEFHYRGVHRNERPYSCNYCHKSFTQSGALNLHVKKHFGVRDFKCTYCHKAFYELHKLNFHERTHTGERPYKCEVCNKAFSDPSAFKRHERIHTGDKRYRCSVCPMAFTDHSALYAHRSQHDPTRKRLFRCDKCEKRFYNKNHLKSHYFHRHSIEYKFICDNCDLKFRAKRSLVHHIQRWHNGMRKIHKCNTCSKTSLSEVGMKNHIKNFHSNENEPAIYCEHCLKYFRRKSDLEKHRLKENKYCEICDKVFPCERSLDIHLNVHVKPKCRYECDYCGYTHTIRYMIIKHILRYHSKKNYECDYCQRRFAFKTYLRNHIITNHLEVFRCNICYKSFHCNFDLKRHKMTNCAVAKYICKKCEKQFKSRSRLRQHKIRHMNREVYKCPMCAKKFRKTSNVKQHMKLHHTSK